MGKIDGNRGYVAMAVTDNASQTPTALQADSTTGRLLIEIAQIVTTTSPVLSGKQIDGNSTHVSTAVDATNDVETPLIADNRNDYLFIDITT